MKAGIIIIKDYALQDIIQKVFPNWLVLVSDVTQEDVRFYPLPKDK